MNYTVEDLDRVMEETKASYQEVKAALEAADGNADEAIEALKGKKAENKKLDDLKTNDELLHRAISRVIGKKCCEITFEEEKQQLLSHPEVLEAFKLFFDGQMLSHLD